MGSGDSNTYIANEQLLTKMQYAMEQFCDCGFPRINMQNFVLLFSYLKWSRLLDHLKT